MHPLLGNKMFPKFAFAMEWLAYAGFPDSSVVKIHLPVQKMQEIRVQSLDLEGSVPEEMSKNNPTEEPGQLQSMRSQRAGHDLVTENPHAISLQMKQSKGMEERQVKMFLPQ